MKWKLLLLAGFALAEGGQGQGRLRSRSSGRRIHNGRRLRNIKESRARRWGTRKEPLADGPHVCGVRDQRYCCSGWRTRKGGNVCNVPLCHANQCGDGICAAPNMCRCPDGRMKKTCNENEFVQEVSRCAKTCLNGGRCINGECQCNEGWTGPHCGQPICGVKAAEMVGCRNGGRCIGPDRCVCVYGFTGKNCESDYRAGPCFTRMEKDKCFDQLTDHYSSKELCCNTVGRAWGEPCEECPAQPRGNCGRGYKGPDCRNINECEDIPGICKNCQCQDTPGSYKCIAPPGHTYDHEQNACVDIDECAENPCGAENECTNSPGGYSCACRPGFHKTTDENGSERCVDDRPGTCYAHVSNGQCTDAVDESLSRSQCCCLHSFTQSIGQCFATLNSKNIENCPTPGSSGYESLCSGSGGDGNGGPDGKGPNGDDDINRLCRVKGNCVNGECYVDQDGNPACLCDPGYEPDRLELQCHNVNECQDGENRCPHGHCVDSDGAWYCECDRGYEPGDDRQTCVNVNECTQGGVDKCANGQCIDLPGSWECRCNPGFQADVSNRNQKCTDVDECTTGGEKCIHGRCANIIGDYQCVCNVGFERTEDRKSCNDLDECLQDNICLNGKCKNTAGSYRCVCNQGYKYDAIQRVCKNIDECDFNPCQGGECQDTDGGFVCSCGKYKQLDSTGRRCIEQPPGTCYRIQSLRNKRKCRAEDALPTKMSRQSCCCHSSSIDRPSAFSVSNRCDLCPKVDSQDFRDLCKDSVNPPSSYCDLELNPCGDNGECVDVEGGYECICNKGFELHPSGTMCVDVNECDYKCLNGDCRNLEGDYECVCPGGHHYNIDEGACNDDDECINKPCSGGKCVNTPGGFECLCEPGLVLDESGLICLDKREETCWLDHSKDACGNNIPGRYTAEVCCATQGQAWGDECKDCQFVPRQCRHGYVYDYTTEKCADANECELFPEVCSHGAKCVNTEGSFHCECAPGLTLDSSQRRCIDTREATCYPIFNATHPFCHNPWDGLHTRQTCCCSIAGGAWGDGNQCRSCPQQGTQEYVDLCPCDEGNCYNPNPDNPDLVKPINNCLEFPEICGEFGECEENDTGPVCNCAPGFSPSDMGFPCIDIPECDIVGDLCGKGECLNTPGSFECTCNEGYYQGPDGKCININECLQHNTCLGGANCTDTEGGFECDCSQLPGRHLSEDGRTCVDDNECDLQVEPCLNGRCINMIGDWKCQCNTGYLPRPNQKSCVNENECLTDNGRCAQKCLDTEGSFLCSCNDGYVLSPNGFDCIDVDECNEEPAICGGGKCENLLGNFTCHCLPGYEPVSNSQLCINVNECDENPDICVHGDCTDTDGSFTCDCFEGFCISLDTMLCQDEDECAQDVHMCDANAECTNEVGTYSCHCSPGFDGDGVECVDNNECEDGIHACDINAECLNTLGSYGCKCHQGYVGNGFNCSDVLDCEQNENICGPHGTCINSPGDYSCECEEGYAPSYNGKECEDINECKGDLIVCENGNCVNMDGTYACECHAGYQLNDAGDQCVDIDECFSEDENVLICLAGECINTVGSYRCKCPPNFSLTPNGEGCVDTRTGNCYAEVTDEYCDTVLGEDVTRSQCCCSGPGNAWSVVVDGVESECEPCPDIESVDHENLCISGIGFTPNLISMIMEDIDECAELPLACEGGNCKNTFGSFTCECPAGYVLDDSGLKCIDEDECEQVENPCSPGICMNRKGSHNCICPNGYMLSEDGRSCEDNRMGTCFKSYDIATDTCSDALLFQATRKACCCAGDLGQAWGAPCDACPAGDAKIEFCKGVGSACDIVDDLCRGGYCIDDPGHDINCECPAGLELIKEHFICEDINECEDENIECPRFSECVNTHGSYNCVCRDGFTDKNGVCVDIDECAQIPGTCRNGKCENHIGTFSCECEPGFIQSEDLKSCDNEDECQYIDRCGLPDAVKQCIDLEGSYRCICNTGYKYNRETMKCENVDECTKFAADTNVCRNGECEDTPGGFICHCDDGFTISEDGRTCIDIDECYDAPCGNGICKNLNGNYTCACDSGYEFDGFTCRDYDECNRVEGICQFGTCENTEGSFVCHCPYGFVKTPDGTQCVDNRVGLCFIGGDDTCGGNPLEAPTTKGECCCQCQEGSWIYDDKCETCPRQGSDAFQELCPKGCGKAPSPDGYCKDINECDLMSDICINGTCINTDGSFACECGKGFHLDSDGYTCVDTNECEGLTNPCGRGKCSNDLGGYKCECDDGYSPTGPDGSCRDINECKTGAHQCSYRCKNETPENGRYSCTCPPGYALRRDKLHCEDVDECAANPDPCRSKGQVCKNVIGHYLCHCPTGMRRRIVKSPGTPMIDTCEDIDECAENENLCKNGKCMNKDGGYWCKCNPGFEANAEMTKCEDTREFICYTTKVSGMCLQTEETSSSKAVRYDQCCCSGHGAGWGDGQIQKYQAIECKSCPDVGSDVFKELCPAGIGYDGNGKVIDDCTVVPNACENGVCVNNMPGYTCMCDEGFQIDDSGTKCIDVDECSVGTHNCPAPAQCKNNKGGFECHCPAGYAMEKEICIDIDECRTKNNNCQYLCLNTIGSYECECPKGFVKQHNTCVDRDECQEHFNICGPRGICVNDAGSWHCECKRGYRLNANGDACEDVNECRLGRCGRGGCNNIMGSFRCNSMCPDGFMPWRGRCMDVNECQGNPCQAGQSCSNRPGSFACNCDGGYSSESDGSCSDINECSINGGTCSSGCSNTNGGYSCGCPNNYYKAGNGHCISSPQGFQQFQQEPGFNQGWRHGVPARQAQPKARLLQTSRIDRPGKCFNPGCQKMRSRRLSNFRGKRDTEEANSTFIEVDGTSPDAEIDQALPVQLTLDRAESGTGKGRQHKLLYLLPSHQPLKQNVKYHIQIGAGKGDFKISQHNGVATLHIAKDKINDLTLDRYNLVIRAISMLDDDVIDLLSEDVPTIKKDLKEPLRQLEVVIEVI